MAAAVAETLPFSRNGRLTVWALARHRSVLSLRRPVDRPTARMSAGSRCKRSENRASRIVVFRVKDFGRDADIILAASNVKSNGLEALRLTRDRVGSTISSV